MVNKEGERTRAPFLVLLSAFFRRDLLLTLDPAWLKSAKEIKSYSLLLVRSGFWVPIKDFRLIPNEEVERVVAYNQKAKGIYSITIFLASLFGMGSFIELFDIYSRVGEHLVFNMLMIGMFLVLVPGILLLWISKDRVKAKEYPIAHVNDEILKAKKNVNVALWAFQIITIVLTAILQTLKVSAERSGNKEAFDIINSAHEEGTEKLPQAVVEIASASQESESILSVLGGGILRSIFGGGIILASAFGILEILSSLHSSLENFLLLYGLSTVMLIIWQVRIFRKYRVNV